MSYPTSRGAQDAPKSIKEITDQAEQFNFNTNIRFKYWIHSCKTLRQEATFALREGDYARAYLMLYRESSLIMNHLPTHPDFKDTESLRLYKPLLDDLSNLIQQLEQIKPIIKDEYDEFQRMTAAISRASHSSSSDRQVLRPRAPRDGPRIVDVTPENVDYAVGELHRRHASQRVSRPSGYQPPSQSRSREYWIDPDYSYDDPYRRDDLPPRYDSRDESETDYTDSNDDWRVELEATRRTLDSMSSHHQPYDDSFPAHPIGKDHQPYYPSTSRSRPVNYVPEQSPSHETSTLRPQRPPKEAFRDDNPFLPRPAPKPDSYRPSGVSDYRDRPSSSYHAPPSRLPEHEAEYSRHDLPPRPRKERYEDPYERTAYDRSERPPPPPKHIPEDLTTPEEPTSKRVAFRAAARLENGEPIRYVFLPDQLRSAFLKIAHSNTSQGLETCGILCGTPVNNALFVTCLLIPEQKSTPDTCETVNESAMLDYCIAEDLLIIGWIHTHPTQSCFMSSRDLHTQAGYQVMMPESIAIVCAPRHEPSYGIFRLTNPPGLPYILNCNQSETFHQHHIDNIYTGALRPAGHVCEVAKLSFKVHDLRP